MNQQELEDRKKLIFDMVSDEGYKSMKIREMAIFLNVPKRQRSDFHLVIEALVKEGKIVVAPNGKIILPEDHVKTGQFMGTRRGFGFVRILDEDDDVFPDGVAVHGGEGERSGPGGGGTVRGVKGRAGASRPLT